MDGCVVGLVGVLLTCKYIDRETYTSMAIQTLSETILEIEGASAVPLQKQSPWKSR